MLLFDAVEAMLYGFYYFHGESIQQVNWKSVNWAHTLYFRKNLTMWFITEIVVAIFNNLNCQTW